MREAARHLAPGRLALRLQQLRDLVEHQHEPLRAGVAGQRGAGDDELAPAGVGAQRQLLAPLGLARLDVTLQHFVQLGEQRLPGRDLRERAARAAREIDAEDAARRLVGDAHPQVRLQRDDAAGEAREDHRERRALGLDRGAAALRLLARAGELLGHVVERGDEEADLVVRRAQQARVEVAFRDRARARDEVLHRAHEALGKVQRAVHGSEQRHQQHERERQHERRLQRLAQVGELPVLLVGGLHRRREVRKALRNRVGRDQQQRAGAGPGADRRRRAHLVAAAGRRLQAHVGLAPPQLHQEVLGRHGRQRMQHARAAECDRLPARARDHELLGAGGAQLVVEREVERALGEPLEPAGDAHGAVEVLAHAQVERRAREAERVGQALAYLGVEPAVDAARQEHDREGEHEQQRRDREAAEHQERPAAQARARDVAAPVAHEVRETAPDQDQERDDAGDVDEQDQEVQLAEALRTPGGHRQHHERRDPDHESRADDERQPAPDHGRTFQAYHSVLRDQSFQNSSMRTAAGSSPTSTVARTRMSKRRPSGSTAVSATTIPLMRESASSASACDA